MRYASEKASDPYWSYREAALSGVEATPPSAGAAGAPVAATKLIAEEFIAPLFATAGVSPGRLRVPRGGERSTWTRS